jgi:hypothetical protein
MRPWLVLLLLLAAIPARADESCADKKPASTDIVFNTTIADPYYDLTMDRETIQRDGRAIVSDWIRKNKMQDMWWADDLKTEGYASGAWGMYFRISYGAAPYDPYGAVFCPFFKTVEVDLMFRTLIAIPGEYKEKRCTYGVINDHEMKHYEANRKAAETYISRLKNDMPAIIARIEDGAASRGQIRDRFAEMQRSLTESVSAYFTKDMAAKTKELNDAIDTPAEYALRTRMMQDCGEN